MNRLQRKTVVILALVVFVFSAYLLAMSSPWLLIQPVGLPGMPLGTLITWAGIVSLPVASLLGFHKFLSREIRPARVSRLMLIGLLLSCTAWGLVGYGLAGNWAFNFSNQTDSFQGSGTASKIFWAYSISLIVTSLLASVVFFVFTLFFRHRDW